MIKKVLLGVLGLVGLAVVVAAAGLTWAHVAIRRERAALPSFEAVLAADSGADRPVAVSWLNTASQAMPRAAVLDPGRDPHPRDPYVMSHPAFVLEWADGRKLLVDVGMTWEGAAAFGKPLEWLAGAAPIAPLSSVAQRLGKERGAVQGVIFTHLHTDHTGGITELCGRVGHPLRVFMTEAQEERPNFTTRPGLSAVRNAGCTRIERLSGGALMAVPGFPGVFVIAAGGHTPGSQIVLAQVQSEDGVHRYAFTGDIVNNIDGINANIPKPSLYRLLVVPEDNARQDLLRRFLRELRDGRGFTLLVSHDQRELEGSGVPAWHPAMP